MSGPEGPVAAKHGVRERPPGEARSSAETEDGQPRGEIPEKPKSKRAKRRRGRRGRGGARPPEAKPAAPKRDAERSPQSDRLYAALDLGTNNCRLLIARRAPEGFKVVDAYSRIVRLGEGLAGSGALSDAAMARAIDALRICAEKMKRRGVTRARTIATAACRTAANGEEFIARVRKETGLSLEIVSTEDEARLAVAGCAPLLDSECTSALVFDIGGGSTELIWVRLEKDTADKCRPVIGDWVSLPCGVVTLAERHGGVEVPGEVYRHMVSEVAERLVPFLDRLQQADTREGAFHLLGTSGTVTTIAGVHLGLERYDRMRVDGIWISPQDVRRVTRSLLEMDYARRAAHPCVGQERADLVLAGCAIFEAISDAWPADRLRVADRGLREGILMSLMDADAARRRRRRRRRKSRRGAGTTAPAGVV
jgi:exopolyphosphatase/guanosine-5'-triphosphate,3'-diphosphate pyrophosphatase